MVVDEFTAQFTITAAPAAGGIGIIFVIILIVLMIIAGLAALLYFTKIRKPQAA